MIALRFLDGAEIRGRIDEIAALRIDVFRDFPYLYEGSLEYEQQYLAPYIAAPDASVVGAFEGDRLVGVATGTPMEDHADDFAVPLEQIGLDPHKVFYCAESVLLRDYRGQGIGHRFFDLREAHARALGRSHAMFCAVIRSDDHPARPRGYHSLDPFWRARGYAPVAGAMAHFSWQDVGDEQESAKALQVWLRAL